MIKQTNGVCNSSQFFPCACCDSASHDCVQKSASLFDQISACSIFKIFHPSCKLDTSIYCCISKQFTRKEASPNNITLFNKYCKKSKNLDFSLVNIIIPSCDPISKRCYNAKHSVTPVLLPISNRIPKPIFIPPSNNKTDVTSSVIKYSPKNEVEISDKKKLSIDIEPNVDQQDTNEKDKNINTNRSIVEFQASWSLIFILITIAFVTIS